MSTEKVVPGGWWLTNLGEIAQSIGGGTPSKAEPAFWEGGNIPWVSPKDMKSFRIISSEDRITAAATLKLSLIPAGSVLLVVRSGILSRTLPVAINDLPVTINQDMRAFVLHAGVLPRYVAWQLIARERDILSICAKDGTTVASIEAPALSGFPLLLAPEKEQTRIVEKLEELLSDIDAGVAELKAAQKKLALYRQSLLKSAVEGALTAEWRRQHPPRETGAELLQRILTERRARWKAKQLAKFAEQGKAPPKDWQKKYPEPVAANEAGLPSLPHGWVLASLDALICDGPQNGLYLPASRYGSGTPILRIDDYQIGWHRERAALNLVDADPESKALYSLAVSDLVINRVNSMTHLGKSLLIDKPLEGALFESNMMRLNLAHAVSGSYIAQYLGSDVGRSRLIRDAKWAVNQASINQQDVKRTPIPLPPAAEQAAITELLDQQLRAAADQDQAVQAALKQATAQRQNILRAAFSGQLVPQDPADEPASVLLERVRAQRAGAAANPQSRRARRPAASKATP